MAKTSISLDDADLEWLRRRAERVHGGNLSAAIAEAARLLRHHEAMGALLDRFAAPMLTDEESRAIAAELDAPARAARGKRRRRAA